MSGVASEISKVLPALLVLQPLVEAICTRLYFSSYETTFDAEDDGKCAIMQSQEVGSDNAKQRNSDISSDSSSHTGEHGQPRFAFVLDKNQPGLRTHAMRAHWQERRKRLQGDKSHHMTRRPLRAKSDSVAEELALSFRNPLDSKSPGTRTVPSVVHTTNAQTFPSVDTFPVAERQHQQYGQTTNSPDLGTELVIPQGIRAQVLTGLNYALSSSRLDPFEVFPVVLTTAHHKLIHHWLTTHATMMFDQMPAFDFNPMRDVWFPLDLSNAASFNSIMAHSAAHLAYLYGGTAPTRGTTEFQALQYKAQAVKILSQWLNDPKQSLSNDAFAAVVRLLTFERYWGTEEEWQVHRDGLQGMIEARGGLHELHDDWRLQLVVCLVSLMSQPSWFSPTNNLSGVANSYFLQSSLLGLDIDIRHLRSLWLISFIQDMRHLMSMSSQLHREGLLMFPAIYSSVLAIKSNYEADTAFSMTPTSPLRSGHSDTDNDRLSSLLSICVIVQESLSQSRSYQVSSSSPNDMNALAVLDMSLSAAPTTWKPSIHATRSFLHQHFLRFYASGYQKVDYVMQMTSIISSLSLEAHRGIEQCLLNMLCRSREGGLRFGFDQGETPDSLLSSVHGL